MTQIINEVFFLARTLSVLCVHHRLLPAVDRAGVFSTVKQLANAIFLWQNE